MDDLLAATASVEELRGAPRQVLVDALRDAVESARRRILSGEALDPSVGSVLEDATARVALAMRPSLRRVVNATGIIVHTNLGRSVLAASAARAAAEVASGYSTLEYDVDSGERGSRHTHVESLICRLTGAEAAFAVNNNAAAVMMTIAAFARGREAIVSRGQLVEIGGSFRVPDIMAESGASMVEVGTTNKTHLADYERAVSDKTGLMLKVHSSNYRVVGFTNEVSLAELVDLGRRTGVPVFEDQGSGVLFDLSPFGLIDEPTVGASVSQGADVVSCSGDKLLGGPQAGIVVGTAEAVARLKKHPMARALRLDKMTLAALEETLRICLDHGRALREIPTLRMLTAPREEMRARATRMLDRLVACASEGRVVGEVLDEVSRAGGGALPLVDIPTAVLVVTPSGTSAAGLCEALRLACAVPIVARIKDDRVLIDPRTLLDEAEEDYVVDSLVALLGGE